MKKAILLLLVACGFASAQCSQWSYDPLGGKIQCVGNVKKSGGSVAIGATLPEGAPAGSMAVKGKYYGDGSGLTNVGTGSVHVNVACSGDVTEAIADALTSLATTGGVLELSAGSCYATDQIVLPNDGQAQPQQKAIRITGQMSDFRFMTEQTPTTYFGATLLDLRSSNALGKIVTYGHGSLEIDHIEFIDTTDGTAPFLYTTNTALSVHDNAFVGRFGARALTATITAGNPTTITATGHNMATDGLVYFAGGTGDWAGLNGARAVSVTDANTFTVAVDSSAYAGSFAGTVTGLPYQDAIVLGGTVTTGKDTADANAPFQGYPTRIWHNGFNNVQRAVYGRVWANNVQVGPNNGVFPGCGGYAPIEFNGFGASPLDTTSGNIIFSNDLQANNYVSGLRFVNALNNIVVSNVFWDAGTSYHERYYLDASTGNSFIGNKGPWGTVAYGGSSAASLDNQAAGEEGTVTVASPYNGMVSALRTKNAPIYSYQNSTSGLINTFYRSRGTFGSPTSVSAGDTLGFLSFNGYSTGAAEYRQSAYIQAVNVGGVSGASVPGALLFATTASGAGSPAFSLSVAGTGTKLGIGPNYIATETGADNAIAGALTYPDASSTAVALVAGLSVTVKLAHALQAGANTFNLNAGGAKAIKSHRNVANDIGAAYVSGALVTLQYDGTQWQDVSQ